MIQKTYSFKMDEKVNDVYTLSNANGYEVDILTYGGRITRIFAPDKNGRFDDLIVGCAKPEDYYEENPYFGATIGRYGNRIEGAKFTLNGQEYHIEQNEKGNTLHGGYSSNFDRVIWAAKIDKDLIPHGEYEEIDGTPYSFYTPKLLGKDMFADAEMIKHCNGFDFNYCIERETERDLELCARVYDFETGRKMECYTTLPGVQLYTACGMGGFKGKKDYVNHCALCLETQGYPNSPNCPQYPSTVLKAGEIYHEITVYKFSVV